MKYWPSKQSFVSNATRVTYSKTNLHTRCGSLHGCGSTSQKIKIYDWWTSAAKHIETFCSSRSLRDLTLISTASANKSRWRQSCCVNNTDVLLLDTLHVLSRACGSVSWLSNSEISCSCWRRHQCAELSPGRMDTAKGLSMRSLSETEPKYDVFSSKVASTAR